MRTICLASTKGGVGKTTLAAALAIEAMGEGNKVALIDADPQQSLSTWHDARGEQDNPALIGGKNEAIKARHDAAKRSGYDICFIDTPPAMIGVIEPCVRLSEFVVVPVRPSPLDIDAVGTIHELCEEQKRPFMFVLNQTTARSAFTEQAAKLLRKDGTVFDGEIVARMSYVMAMVRGLTAPEIDRSNAQSHEEIAALWKAIKRRLPKL